jgi:hypothetical protein
MLCTGRLAAALAHLALLLRGLLRVDAVTYGPAPSARELMGFAATPDGMLYVFGGSEEMRGMRGGMGWVTVFVGRADGWVGRMGLTRAGGSS